MKRMNFEIANSDLNRFSSLQPTPGQ